MGRAIASALPKPHKNNKGYIEAANGDVVSWCIGHLLEQAEPEDYNTEFKKWRVEHLPIVPDKWQLKPISRSKAQVQVLRKLIKKSSQLIHAGDPDREGQLLVDELIDYLNPPNQLKQNALRLLVNDLNTSAIAKALKQLKPNQEFMPLSISALARSRADWLYGINLTRAYTLQGQKCGYNSVLSIGRVQTPLLGLVVRRDQEIDNFKPTPYFNVYAEIEAHGQTLLAKWQPSEHCQPYMDSENRVLVKALAENVINRITNQPATATEVKQQQKSQAAPLPYNLSALQIDAAKRFSMNAKMVLDVCQGLYEKHKLITYPRSDCRYLPQEQFADARGIISTLINDDKAYSQAAKNADPSRKSKAWNTNKVGAHHAIIPTGKNSGLINLNTFEKNIYQLIVIQYLAQFYPPHKFDQTTINFEIAGGAFKCSAKSIIEQGWKVLFTKSANKTATSSSNSSDKLAQANSSSLSKQFSNQLLPPIKKGEVFHCRHGLLDELMTTPPKHFTDATLLAAMTNIARFVEDPHIKSILRENDGLGTEATRAGIIELLFKRQFLKREGKNIIATDVGKALINALPASATLPDMTAHWESTLTDISNKQKNYQQFMQPLTCAIQSMVEQSSHCNFGDLPKVQFKPKRKRSNTRKKYPTKKTAAKK